MDFNPAPRKSPWLKLALWIGIPLAFLFLLCASPFVTFWIWTRGHVQEANRQVAEIEAKGEPLSLEQLSTDFTIPEGQEDVGSIWIEAMQPISTREFAERAKTIPFIGRESIAPPSSLSEPWPQLEESEQFLQSCELTLRKIEEAASRGGYARFPIDYSKGHQTLMPHIQEARGLARILQLDFEVKARRLDIAGATKTLKSLFIVSRSTKQEPMIVPQLVGFAMDGVAKKTLADKLCQLRFEESDLQEFRSHLQNIRPIEAIRVALLGERAMGFAGMRDLSTVDPKLPAKPAMASDVNTFLKYMTKYLDALDTEFPSALQEVDKIEKELKDETENLINAMTKVMTLLWVPATGALFETIARDLSTTAAADAGIACELYRRENGKLPTTLNELVPKYLPSIPIDPFTGQPVIYKVDEQGFKIYSLGKNKIDDGGKLDPKPGEDNRIRDEGLFFPTK